METLITLRAHAGATTLRITWADQVRRGGRSGIRTHERVAPLTVFKTVAFVRSAILPQGGYVTVWSRHRGPG